MSDSGGSPWGLVSIIGVVLGLAVYASRVPSLAQRAWDRSGYPSVEAAVVSIDASGLPWRPLSIAVVARAVDELERASEASGDEMTRHLLAAQGYTMAAYFVLHGPAVLLIWVLGLAGGRALVRERRPPALDLDRLLVTFAAGEQAPPGLPSADLPLPPGTGPGVCFDPGERATYEHVATVAREHGADHLLVSETLADVPLGLAALIRKQLALEVGLSDRALTEYEEAWYEDRALGGEISVRERRALRRFRELRVPPGVVRGRELLRRAGELSPLRERLLSIAVAHADWPASMEHHGAKEGGLLEHYGEVLCGVLDRELDELDRGAILTLATAHDLGKVWSYQRTEEGWTRLDARHAQNTALLLSSLEEFRAEHPEDGERILLAAECEHSQKMMPLSEAAGCQRILKVIKEVDGAAAAEEPVEEVRTEAAALSVVDAMPELIRSLRINRTGSSWHVHGFWEPEGERGEEVLILSEQQMRQQLQGLIPEADQRALQLWQNRPRGKVHPGIEAMVTALGQAGAIPSVVRNVQPEDGMVSIRAGKRNFKAMIPMSLDWLRERMGEELDGLRKHWEHGERFEILVLAGGWSLTNDELNAIVDQLTNEAKEEEVAPYGRCPACERPMKLNDEQTHLCCKNFFAARKQRRKCDVRFKWVDGKPLRTCHDCGKELTVVKPRFKPAFMGCPDHCRAKEKVHA